MGMIQVDMYGSFPTKLFKTCAEEGGHVMAIKRTIEFLTDQLGFAVREDAELIKAGVVPETSPVGYDLEDISRPVK